MAVTFGAAGTLAAFSTTPTSVAYPTGISAGNLLVLVGLPKVGATALASQPALSGWTSQGYVRHGTTATANDAGSMAVMVWTKVADGTETGSVSVAWGLTPAAGQAFMYRLANATSGWDVAVQTVARTATTTAWSVTFGANPGLTVGDFVAVANAVPTDLSTASAAGTLTATGLTTPGTATALVAHQPDGTGSDSAIWADYYIPTAGTASAAPTYASTLTGGTNLYGVSAIIRAREIVVAPFGVSAGADDDHLVNTAFTRTATQIAATSHAWTIQSGPTGVGSTIGTAAALSWTPTTAGTYVLRYTATNGAGSTFDEATVYVEAASAVNDTFTRTSTVDPGVADTGQEWISRSGTWGTNGTQLYTVTGADADIASVLVGTATQVVRATMPTAPVGGPAWCLLARYESAGTFYSLEVNGSGVADIKRFINGAFTGSVATSAAGAVSGTPNVLELSVAEETTPTAGTRTIVTLNGTQLLTGLDTAGTRPLNGIRSAVRQGSTGTALRWDDFQVNYTGPTTSATGAITLGGSVTGTATAPSTAGAITLGGAPAATAAATAAGTITLGGSTTPSVAASSVGTITLGGSATASQPGSTASGAITLGGTPTARGAATAAGAITLGGSVTATVTASAAGSLTLGGAPTATAPASVSGAITLSGAPTGRASAATTGTITLGGSATATQPGSNASGTITLGGTATAGVTASAAGSITLGGSPTARAAAAAAGTITLGGTSTASATSSAAGSISLTGAPTARAAATAAGVITLGGSGTVQVPGSTAAGSVTLGGSASARGVGSVNGVIVLGGSPTGRAAATTGGVIVLGGAPTVAVTASAAGAIFLSGIANGVDGSIPPPVEFDIAALVSPTLGATSGGSPTAKVSASSPSLSVWANSPTILLTL